MKINKTFIKLVRMGFQPHSPSGQCPDASSMFAIFEHNDVEYSIDDLGVYEEYEDSSSLLEALVSLDLVVERHHTEIKAVKQFIEKLNSKDIWVSVNPGLQLSVTFGDDVGAIGDMLLSFPSDEALEEFKNDVLKMSDYDPEIEASLAEIDSQNELLLVVTDVDYIESFKRFKHKNIIVRNINDIDDFDDLGEDDDE